MHWLIRTSKGYKAWDGESNGPDRLVGTEDYVRLVARENWEGSPQELKYYALCLELGRLPQPVECTAAGITL